MLDVVVPLLLALCILDVLIWFPIKVLLQFHQLFTIIFVNIIIATFIIISFVKQLPLNWKKRFSANNLIILGRIIKMTSFHNIIPLTHL